MKLIIEYQYFGSVNLYKILYKSSNILFEQYENYQKSSFRNKTTLLGPSGVQYLSIPILGGRGVKCKMKDVEIDYNQNWQLHHIKTIKNLYNASPWFEYYETELDELYKMTPHLLKDWNLECFKWVCKKLKINAIMAETEEFKLEYPNNSFLDWRDCIKKNDNNIDKNPLPYIQVFQEKIGFYPNVSILDLLFCEGPHARALLKGE